MTLPTLALALASTALFAAQPAFADAMKSGSMKTDTMKASDSMMTHKMKDDCMGKSMTKEEKAACKAMMKKGKMKKHDAMMKKDTMKPTKSSGN
jgi:hypothetical protein